MQYPLYEYYNQSNLTLYEVRKHFLEHFYYKKYSKESARNVLKIIVSSSRVGRLIRESVQVGTAPSWENYLNTVCSIIRIMFKPIDTITLAIIDAALRWDIEVNKEMKMQTPEELKQSVIEVFRKHPTYKTMPEAEALLLQTSLETGMKEEIKESMEENVKPKFKLKTWTLIAFIREFGEMEVGEFMNNKTGDLFKSCVFTKGTTRTFVAFSSKLGELTPHEIESQKDRLVVVQLPSGKYRLAKPKRKRWKRVNI